eukprot:gene15387-biopygen11226
MDGRGIIIDRRGTLMERRGILMGRSTLMAGASGARRGGYTYPSVPDDAGVVWDCERQPREPRWRPPVRSACVIPSLPAGVPALRLLAGGACPLAHSYCPPGRGER